MSDNPLEEKRISGVISGFDQYKTGQDAPDQSQSPHNYTLTDFYNALRDLLKLLDKIQLERIESLINSHIYNYKNPHKDTLESLGINILNELYKIWLTTNPVVPELTYEFFLKVLFQYVEVASIDEAVTNRYPHKLISVLDLIAIINQHNEDPNAHANLVTRLVPGQPINSSPILAWHSFYMFPRSEEISSISMTSIKSIIDSKKVALKHDPNQYYIQSDGRMHKLAANDIPIEWIDGNPYLSLWRTRTRTHDGANLIPYSEDFTRWTLLNDTKIARTITDNNILSLGSVSDLIYLPLLDTNITPSAYYIGEPLTSVSSIKGLSSPNAWAVEANTVYTFSFFVRYTPYSRPYTYIKFTHDKVDNTYRYAHFSIDPLDHRTYKVHEDITGIKSHAYIVPLAHGWCRCVLSMKFEQAGNIQVSFGPLDHFGGDLSYANNVSNGYTINDVNYGGFPNGLLIFGAQLEHNTEASPYMRTTGSAYVRSTSSIIAIPFFNHAYLNYIEGTLAVSYLNHSILQDAYLNLYTLFSLLFPNNVNMITASIRSVNDSYSLRNVLTNSNNSTLINDVDISSLEPDILIQQACSYHINELIHSYATDFQSTSLSKTISSSVLTHPIYNQSSFSPFVLLGNITNSYAFNGYIQSLIYYPQQLSEASICSLIDYTKSLST
jgi:hypothetical protein